MTIPNVVLVDQSYSKKSGQSDLALSSYNLPASLVPTTPIANILNVRSGLTPIAYPFWNYQIGGNGITGWTLLVGAVPPTLPTTVLITAGGQTQAFALFPSVTITAPATISAPILTKTSSTGANPLAFTINAPDSSIFVGEQWHLQLADDAGFTTNVRNETKYIILDDFNGDAYFLLLHGMTAGPVYARLRVLRDDGEISAWSNVISDTIAATLGFVPGAKRSDRSALAATGDRFTLVAFAAGRPILSVIRKGVTTALTVNGHAATKIISNQNTLAGDGFTEEYSLWIGGQDETAGNYTVDITASVTNNDCRIYTGTGTAITTYSGTSKRTQAFFNNGNSVAGDASLTVTGGVTLGLAFLTDTGTPTYSTAMTTSMDYGDAQRWVTFTTTQTPAFTTDVFSVCGLAATVLTP